MITTIMRVRDLNCDNGIQVANKSMFSKMKCASEIALKIVAVASIFKMLSNHYEFNFDKLW